MKKPRIFLRYFWAFIICIILLFSCANEDKYIGTYAPMKKPPPELAGLTVELKKNGQGIRRVRGEEVFFEWSVKSDEIRFHTKDGGIIVAKIRNNILEVSLPGPVTRYLKKVD